MKRVAIVSLVALVLLAGCAAPLQETANGTASADEPPTVSVSASGTATADPDLAVIAVSVEATADSADAARGQVAADVARMREALRNAGVPADAVRTTAFQISPVYNYSKGSRELVGYRAVHAFAIEVAPGDAGSTIDVAVGNGATSVDSVQFTLSEEKRRELREQAINEAMDSARADADTIASKAGMQVTGLQRASTSADYVPYRAPLAESVAGGAGDKTVLEPAPVTVSAHVSVTYTADEA